MRVAASPRPAVEPRPMNVPTPDTEPTEPRALKTPLTEVREFVAEVEPTDFNPLAALGRLLRGRWLILLPICALLAGALGLLGYSVGTPIFESRAIIRILAREPSILFATGDDSRLKLFQAFVKGETIYVASHPVMERALAIINAVPVAKSRDWTVRDLSETISITRNEALIIVTAKSTDPAFAATKVNAVVDAYLALHAEGAARRAVYREGELAIRERNILEKLQETDDMMLKVGGEYGMISLVKAHIEKVAQLESMMMRRAEIASTLAAMESNTSLGNADMGDGEIKRAILLDRGLADLAFDKVKREAELVTLLLRYSENSREVHQKRLQIEVIDQAIANRREQISVLGRTGALTNADAGSEEDSKGEIRALLDKVSEQLETARADARVLNGKRIELNFLKEERAETRRMLDETRRALDVIRVESRNVMPGLIEVMSRGVVPDRPAKDKRKMLGVGGFVFGGLLGFVLVLGFALTRGRVRFTDDLWRLYARVPLLRALSSRPAHGNQGFGNEIDQVRNAIQLFPDRDLRSGNHARIISVTGIERADSTEIAHELAKSFAASEMPTLLIDADLVDSALTERTGLDGQPGWRELLAGGEPIVTSGDPGGLQVLGAGIRSGISDETVSVRSVRAALARSSGDFSVIVIHIGRLEDRLSADLIASASDLILGVVRPGDHINRVERRVCRVDELARNGCAIVFAGAQKSDPAFAD